MMRLGISVEGPTEREFINRVLKPHLVLRGWDIVKPISLNGGVSLNRFKEEIRLLSPNYEYVTTLYDFYRFEGRDSRDAEALEETINEYFLVMTRLCMVRYWLVKLVYLASPRNVHVLQIGWAGWKQFQGILEPLFNINKQSLLAHSTSS